MSKSREQKAEQIRHLLETEGDAIHENTSLFNEERYNAIADSPGHEDFRTQAREIKEEAIANLPDLIEQVREAVEENGGTVYLADDAEDANRYIEEVADEKDAESVVKSKSMTTEELSLNDHLESADIDVYETDLGEFVIQVAEEEPSHIVGPSLHKSREDITELFESHFDTDHPLDSAEALTRFARDYLGKKIEHADIGMTGANFVFAESGTIALVTNEGNARKCAVTPDTHVAVAGIEKIIPSIEEFHPFLELLARSSTGQDITQYVSLLTPPVETPGLDFADGDSAVLDGDIDRDFHLVLIDNGRTEMREDDDLRETLYCIRCGACANTCGNFQHVGGHAFGGETYTGGIATGWEAGVHDLDSAGEFNDLCTGCSRCAEACPVKIDIPWINTVVRDRLNQDGDVGGLDFLVDGLTPDEETGGVSLQKRFFGNFETLAKLGSATAPISNALAGSSVSRKLMDSMLGIDERRELPSFARMTFHQWFANHESPAPTDGRNVALYPDVYTNYVQVERGKAAVRVLEALGCNVTVPPVAGSGRAPLSQGMVSTAREKAKTAIDTLDPYLDDGHDVVVIEPSDLAMFRSEYENLFDDGSSDRLSENSYEIFEYIYGLLEHGADVDAMSGPDGAGVAYHSHCQQRTLDLDPYTEAVLDRLGYDIVTSEVECCGMAGSFGYKSEYYELSMDVGSDLQEQFEDEQDRHIVASGTSCLEQLDDLLSPQPTHPIELLDPAN